MAAVWLSLVLVIIHLTCQTSGNNPEENQTGGFAYVGSYISIQDFHNHTLPSCPIQYLNIYVKRRYRLCEIKRYLLGDIVLAVDFAQCPDIINYVTSQCFDIINSQLSIYGQATITSPGYPRDYPANVKGFLSSIRVPWEETEGYVSLHFTRFDLETCLFCTCDYLRIDALHMSLCGISLPPNFINNTVIIPRGKILNNLISLEFASDEYNERGGFAIEYELHTFRPASTLQSRGPNTLSTQPVSRCPVAVCPTCREREGHVTVTLNSCPKCVCVVTPAPTSTPQPSKCPVAYCPTCRPGWGHKTVTFSNCPKCICVVTPTPTFTPPPSKCPVAYCPTCLPGMGHKTVTLNNCPKCVCVVTPTPTLTPPPSKCPVAYCPTCLPGMGHKTVTLNNCPKCVCVVTPTPTLTPPPSKCPVAYCPTCLPGMGRKMIYTPGCPRCVCVPTTTTMTPSTGVPAENSIILKLLQDIAHHAETVEYEARYVKEKVHLASTLLQHRVAKRSAEAKDILGTLEDSKEPPVY